MRRLVRIGFVGAVDTDVVVRELEVCAGEGQFWHMAADAIVSRSWAGRGVSRTHRLLVSVAVTSQTPRVIALGIGY